MQHFERGGLRLAPFSSSVSERGRWITQIWPCQSTVMPPTWPRIQLFGSCLGQLGSTAKVGISLAKAIVAMKQPMAATRSSNERAANVVRLVCVDVIAVSPKRASRLIRDHGPSQSRRRGGVNREDRGNALHYVQGVIVRGGGRSSTPRPLD